VFLCIFVWRRGLLVSAILFIHIRLNVYYNNNLLSELGLHRGKSVRFLISMLCLARKVYCAYRRRCSWVILTFVSSLYNNSRVAAATTASSVRIFSFSPFSLFLRLNVQRRYLNRYLRQMYTKSYFFLFIIHFNDFHARSTIFP